MRVLLDANILVSASFSEGNALASLMNGLRSGQFENVTSENILDEVTMAWKKKYWRSRFSELQLQQAVQRLRSASRVVSVSGLVSGEAPHWQDDHILEAALVGECNYIVTGDTEMHHLGVFQGIRIVSPTEFLTAITPAGR